MRDRDRDRSSGARWTRVLVGCWVALAGAGACAATPCSITAQPWLSLRITAGAAAVTADRSLSVRVHGNGCAELHRPAFYRHAGDFRVQLSDTELGALRRQVSAEQLRAFDAGKVRAALASSARSTHGTAETFLVLDADLYQLEVLEAGQTTPATAAWSGLHESAERFPQQAELVALSASVGAMQALLDRSDAVRVTGSAP